MKQILRSFVHKTLAVVNVFPTRMTDRNELRTLLQKLYPVSCNKELIRLGPKGDGGYLVPNDFQGIETCFSPGVGFESGFEQDCAELGMKVFLVDKSVEQLTKAHELFHFTPQFIGVTSKDDFMTIDNWVDSSLPDTHSDLLLQIDIEESEYEVFLSISDILMHRFRIIVAEFHQLVQLWNEPFFNLAARAFEKILQTHTCIHIHPNNFEGSLKIGGFHIPQTLEFTFLRNDRIENPSYRNVFPNPLDNDNNSDNPPLILPKCWYSGE